jgi:hypothetical protein
MLNLELNYDDDEKMMMILIMTIGYEHKGSYLGGVGNQWQRRGYWKANRTEVHYIYI